MRLIVTVRGVNVIDLELRLPIPEAEQPDSPKLEASGGGQAERAEPYGDPATISGFGFVRGPS